MNISVLMPLQPACGGPLSPPDSFFDLCIAFLPVSGKLSFFLFGKKYFQPSFGKIIFILNFERKNKAENALQWADRSQSAGHVWSERPLYRSSSSGLIHSQLPYLSQTALLRTPVVAGAMMNAVKSPGIRVRRSD